MLCGYLITCIQISGGHNERVCTGDLMMYL